MRCSVAIKLPGSPELGGQSGVVGRCAGLFDAFARFVLVMLKCCRAAVSPLTALMLIPISGAIAYSVELGTWQYTQRSMQNAADSAALAAATNNQTTGASNYRLEGKAAAQKFGYVNGAGNTTVQIDPPASVTCPGTGYTTCYAATISTKVPLTFSRLIGFGGNTTYGSGRGQTITAYAIASASGGGTSWAWGCFYTMGNVVNSFRGNGIPDANLTGCSIFSAGQIYCTGNNGTNADYALSSAPSGTYANGPVPCASTPTRTGVTLPTVPYGTGSTYDTAATTALANATGSGCASTIPADYYGTNLVLCGNVKLTGDLTLHQPDTVVVINGSLDLNKNTLSTASGASATLIFPGTSDPFGANSQGTGGTINIQAPSDSVWQGVAMFQQQIPNASTQGKVDFNGAQSNVSITGALYFPQENVTINGIVNKSTYGQTCFIVYSYTVTVNGNGTYLNQTAGCTSAGVTPPSVAVGTRAKLVQ
jgi:hypothetical protein